LERAVIDAVDVRGVAAIDLLRSLIQSPSPSLAEGRADDASSMVGKVFAAACEHGTAVEVQNVAPHSDNVIEELGPRGGQTLVIEAHTDAVPEGDHSRWLNGEPFSGAEGWVTYLGHDEVELDMGADRYRARIRPRMSKIWERFRSDRRRRVIYGRGSFDNKGCVASALLAMDALAAATRATGVGLAGSVVAGYTADEEDGVLGVKRFACDNDSWLAEHGYLGGPRDESGLLTTISGVALDGSYGWVPVIGHRGAVQLAITTRGRAAHAATPELGANAVEAMARILVALSDGIDDIRQALAGVLETSLLGPVTLAIGSTIVGGGVRQVRFEHERVVERAGVNAIPDWCEATVDIRFPQGLRYPLDSEEVKDHVVEAFRRHIARVTAPPSVTHEVRELVWGPPVAMAQTFEAAAQLPLIREERRRAAEVLGFEPELETAPGGTDATFMIHDAKIPTIVELGPAGALSHDVHEFVEADSVIEGAKILALLAISRVGVAQ
jgi:acetylornithine deacetylase/succinyl-diaminopimelate desuccinylase-like protein